MNLHPYRRRALIAHFLTLAGRLVLASLTLSVESTHATPTTAEAVNPIVLEKPGPSSYGEIVSLKIKSHIRIDRLPVNNTPAEVLVEVASDGAVLSAKLKTSSGDVSWDAAVVRAVYETAKLPVDEQGHVPRILDIVFRPYDYSDPTAFSVTLDDRKFMASKVEIDGYREAVQVLRDGHYDVAVSKLQAFVSQFPSSGYELRARFWLGSAQFADRQYQAALESFGVLLKSLPSDHPLRPEAMLSIANCQLKLATVNEAKQTLQQLVDSYPQSEAAQVAMQRLRTLP